MRTKKRPYECPCCGYTTSQKANMRFHFYNLKKPCPKTDNNIELTEEIKEHVLSNRVYKIVQSAATIINNYNSNYNMIASIDIFRKLEKFMKYRNLNTIDFEQSIENKFSHKADKLRINTKIGYALDSNKIMEIIDEVTKIDKTNLEDLNIIYDSKIKRLHIYDSGKWKDWLIESGVVTILEMIKLYFFDTYECYLIRMIEDVVISSISKSILTKCLSEYYTFIAAFDIEPYVCGKSNNKILYNEEDVRYEEEFSPHEVDAYTLEDRFYNLYLKARDSTLTGDIKQIKKRTIDIIKENTIRNVHELNRKVTELFGMDEQFKLILEQCYNQTL